MKNLAANLADVQAAKKNLTNGTEICYLPFKKCTKKANSTKSVNSNQEEINIKTLLSVISIVGIIGVILPHDPFDVLHIAHFDKVEHLTASALVAFTLSQFISIRKSVIIAFLLFTGAEYLQVFLPDRTASISE